jgi:hypothetical protein
MTKLSGPISGGRHGWPYGATVVDLDDMGYVEEEYVASGVAARYRPVGDLGPDGLWQVEETVPAEFVTRVVVRRPVEASRFNGTLIVEWNNVSAGSDIFEAGDTPAVFAEGFAYAGVSAQTVGLHGFPSNLQGLLAWDPERYGALYIGDDALSYGVFSQVARALVDADSGARPLGDLIPTKLVAIGGSQSAGRLVTYINAIHPRDRLFDGFIPFTWFGGGSSIDSPAIYDPSNPASLASLTATPTRIRADLDAKVIVVNSECETLSCVPVRQPDTDDFRFWEVAGAPHGPRLHMERIVAKMEHDGMSSPGGGPIDPAALSPIPWAPVLDAAMLHMHGWLNGGPPPPAQPVIEVATDPPCIRRDDDGNALGGVRVPEFSVARWRCVGAREESGPAGLMGSWSPLPESVVLERFGDREGYLAAFEKAVDEAVAAGILRGDDGVASLERARLTDFP